MDVHAEVLKAGEKETGCTVHMVEEKVDAGEIVIQKSCPVEEKDTPDTLKTKVQALEGEALIEAIDKFRRYMLGVNPLRDDGNQPAPKQRKHGRSADRERGGNSVAKL